MCEVPLSATGAEISGVLDVFTRQREQNSLNNASRYLTSNKTRDVHGNLLLDYELLIGLSRL